MTQSATTSAKPEAAAVNDAFAALKTYDHGSSRAALLPIDEAVVAALHDRDARKELERRLVAALSEARSAPARAYVCGKLALIGSKFCVPALAALLDDPQTATAALNALDAIPHRRAAGALRDRLPKVARLQQVGVINSLGARRDEGSVRVLSALLKSRDLETAGAAGAALGEIGSPRAAKVLQEYHPRAAGSLREQLADACLVCAERLLADGRSADAERLYRMFDDGAQPKHVHYAAVRGQQRASGRRFP